MPVNLRSRKRGSLAGAILRITFLIGAVVIAATLITSLASSYQLASAQSAERQRAYLRVAESNLASYLTAASATADRAAGAVESAGGRDQTRVLASEYIAGSATIDALWLVSPDAELLAAYPAHAEPLPKERAGLKEAVARKRNGFYYDIGGAGLGPELWVIRPVRLGDNVQGELLIRVRTPLLGSAVNQVASKSDQRVAAVVQHSTLVTSGAEAPMVRLADADYGELGEDGLGTIRAIAPSVGTMRGFYTPVEGFPGLPWRVLVAEPGAATMAASLRAIVPTLLVLITGGAIALSVAWGLSHRLVGPLRDVESASLEAAAGAYVPQLAADRNDEVGRLAEAFNVLALRLNALHDVSRLLASASKTTQVLHAIVESVEHLVGPAAVGVYLRDAPSLFHLSQTSFDEFGPRVAITHDQARVFERSVASGALLMPPMSEVPKLVEDPASTVRRVLVAPLVVGDERMGVVLVEQTERHPYTEAELEMVRNFTAQAAVALLNSRLFEEERASREIAEALHLVAEHLVRPVNLGEALAAATGQVSRLLGGRDVVLAVRDRGVLGLSHTADPIREGAILGLSAKIADRGKAGAVALSGADDATAALLARLGSASAFVEDIAPGTPYAAVLAVLDWEAGYNPNDTELIDGATQVLDLALENAYFVERDRARARNLETIFRISQAVGSSLEVRVVLNRVLDVVQMIFAADAVSLMTYDEARRVLATAMARGSISEEILHFEVAPGEDLPGRVFMTGMPVRVAEARDASSAYENAVAALGLRSVLAVPLLARGRPIGVLSVFSGSPDAFDEEDMGLLQTFASQAALAIDTASLYGREHDVAETLQRSILPDQLPEYPEIDSSSAYEPAGLEAEIGGDYYDLFRSPDGRIVFAMADVCGKGVSAATKTSMIKYSIRALVAAGLEPGACLAELNDLVADKGDASDIVTVIVGFIDTGRASLVWANGGHPAGLLFREDSREVVRLETTGPLLGAVHGAGFAEAKTRVGPGDAVLLYTDGVTESRNGDRFFGEGRIRRVLRYGGSAEAITQRLLGTLHRFAPGGLRDDVALLTVRLRGGPSEGTADTEVLGHEATSR